jgi:hypothetical protein
VCNVPRQLVGVRRVAVALVVTGGAFGAGNREMAVRGVLSAAAAARAARPPRTVVGGSGTRPDV